MAQPRPSPLVIAVANRKGGVGKTTSSIHLAAAYTELGFRVRVLDLDPQGDSSAWHTSAAEAAADGRDHPFPFEVTPVRHAARLWTHIPQFSNGYDVLLLDCPPESDNPRIVSAAVRSADLVTVPVTPSTIDISRVAHMRQLVCEAAEDNARTIVLAVHFTRVDRRVQFRSTLDLFRQGLEANDYYVADVTIPLRGGFAWAHGAPLVPSLVALYVPLASELLAVHADVMQVQMGQLGEEVDRG